MNKNIYFISVIMLVIGIGLGYSFSGDKDNNIPEGMHRMPDGTYMTNDGHGMSMDDMMKSMNQELVGKTGVEFDRAFLREMIVHHEGAVEMAKLVLQNAEHEELKSLARDIITAQTKEINQMKVWQAQW